MNNKWLEYPTETGYWWRVKAGAEPRLCYIVDKSTKNENIHIATFPEKETYIYLNEILLDIFWQKLLIPTTKEELQ